MTDEEFARLGREADRIIWRTPRREKGYWSEIGSGGNYYRYADADKWEHDEAVSIGRQVVASLGNILWCDVEKMIDERMAQK